MLASYQVGHTKGYIQVLVVAPDSMLGTSAMARITSVGRWSVFGEVIETLNGFGAEVSKEEPPCWERSSACNPTSDDCSCSRGAALDTCELQVYGQKTLLREDPSGNEIVEDRRSRRMIGWLLRKRKHPGNRQWEVKNVSACNTKQERVSSSVGYDRIDKALLCGILVSVLTIVALAMHFVGILS